ncbi:MAG: CCA tRNA nucleotidyltransferase [Candidatus Krumholzibacteriia bacterium]
MADVPRIPVQTADPAVLAAVLEVCALVRDAGGRAWLVGGGVRDGALGRAAGDADLEVFGLEPDALQALLGQAFALELVGRSFGILKLKGLPIDVGVPRQENKTGTGHRGFAVHADPFLELHLAAARRDFTLNAVYLDPLTGEVADPYDGLGDLQRGILRHTSAAFGEDPLRVLRGMQLAARFDLAAAPETVRICRTVGMEGLARERVFEEWRRLLVLGAVPSRGLHFLAETGWLRFFPELDAVRGVPQDPRHHPEGDVWVHTLHCLDAFAQERLGDPWEDLVVGLAVLCHDLGKAERTTVEADGRIRSLGHEARSVDLARTFLGRMTDQRRLVDQVLPLVAEHGKPQQLYQARSSDAAVRRLADRVGRLDRLVRVARADHGGRPPLPPDFPAGDWLLARAEALGVTRSGPAPLVQGRHLVALGAEPGEHFRAVLEACYEAQLDGKIGTIEQGVALASRLLGIKDR